MNSKERVLKAIKFDFPDFVPIGYSLNPSSLIKYGEKLLNLCKKFPNDFYDIEGIKIPDRDIKNYRENGSYYKEELDEWGCLWVYLKEGFGGEVKKSPIDDWSKLKKYKFPEVNYSKEEIRKKKEEMKKIKEKYIGWGSGGCLFERAQWLRGVENFLVDIALDREEVYILLDLIIEKNIIPSIEISLEIGAEVIGFSDDWGTQNQLLINPEKWRKIFKPRYKRLFNIVHREGALTWLHSDGMIIEILPDFIEIGLNVINPQFSCMDLKMLKHITNKKLCIYTDIDRQKIMPFGKPVDIENYVKKIYEVFGEKEGGLIYGAGIYPDYTFENIEALLKSFYKYRKLN